MHKGTEGEPNSNLESLIRASEYCRPLPVFKGIKSVQNHETGLEKGQWLQRKLRITVSVHCTDEGEQRSKSASPTRAAGCFQRLRKFKGVESVLNHKTGLEKGQWLPRKLRITV